MLAPGSLSAFALALPLLLAGLLPLRSAIEQRWCWSGAWVLPVGDLYALGEPGPDGAPGFQLLRGVVRGAGGAIEHQGADLSNGRGGDAVRAAADGLVVRAARSGWRGGYGRHVVIAHRLAGGPIVYSAYAHLAPGSVRVRAGQMVRAGETIARVGRSGRASAEHLHFEVRQATDPDERWERSPVVDPIAFVVARLPAQRADTTWARPYLVWAECAALLGSEVRGDAPLERATWWTMLAHAARHGLERVPNDPIALRQALIAAHLLPADAERDPAAAVSWKELARDLARAREAGLRGISLPVPIARHRAECSRELGTRTPASHLKRLGRRDGPSPSAADACLAIADLGVPQAAAPTQRASAPAGS